MDTISCPAYKSIWCRWNGASINLANPLLIDEQTNLVMSGRERLLRNLGIQLSALLSRAHFFSHVGKREDKIENCGNEKVWAHNLYSWFKKKQKRARESCTRLLRDLHETCARLALARCTFTSTYSNQMKVVEAVFHFHQT